MSIYLILTVIGDDRPGLVEQLASTVSAHGGNWLESRFSHLAGKFAGILRVQADKELADALQSALEGLSEFRITAERVEETPASPYTHHLQLNLTGHDRIGIVRDVSQVLARFGVNVEKLSTQVSSAPMSGEPLFEATAQLQGTDELDLRKLQKALEQLSDDLMVDITLDPQP